ncbi:hypothetical protein TIFTF001_032950 [Ficus carica]|uniref:Uncharacterized protein n=1 Tax=Ficus carica TaxID=3494 RepID=A0AA88J7C0_FICCA|nr:hypothetical protein TIFTF001_032950 [Ficus carica]
MPSSERPDEYTKHPWPATGTAHLLLQHITSPPPSPTLTRSTPAGTGDNHPTVPCIGSETRGTSPLDR